MHAARGIIRSWRAPDLWNVLGFLYNGLFALRPHRDLVAQVARWVGAEGPVLDAGCGTGRLAKYAPNAAQLMGVDYSTSMLGRASRQRYGLGVFQGDIGDLQFDSGTFIQVVSINVLYAVPDQAQALAELARVLRPGGQLILATPVSSGLAPLLSEHLRLASIWDNLWLLLNTPRILGWTAVLSVRGFLNGSTFTFLPEDQLLKLIESAGFTIQSIEPCYAGIDRLIIATRRAS